MVDVSIISSNFPRPSDSTGGVWLYNQLGAYAKYSRIHLYVPVHMTPSLYLLRKQRSCSAKFRELARELREAFLCPLGQFSHPVPGEYVRYFSVPPKELFPGSGGFVIFLRLLPAFLARPRYDVIHGQGVLPDGLAAVLLGKHFGKPSIVTAIGSDVHSVARGTRTYNTAREVLESASAVTCVSEDLRKRVIDMGVDGSKLSVIRNGCDPDLSKKTGKIRVRDLLNIPLNSKVIGFVGRLTEVKDPLTLIRAFRTVHQCIPDAYLIIVGGGSLADELRTFVSQMRLSDRVRFSEGTVPFDHIPDYMNEFDVFCLSSVREGWPNVLLEAMTLGKPIVATAVGGVPEVVSSAKYGILVPPRDPDRMAEAIVSALSRTWDYDGIREYARCNTWEVVGERYAKLYRNLVMGNLPLEREDRGL